MNDTPFTREQVAQFRERRDLLLKLYQSTAESSEGFPTWREFGDMVQAGELRQLQYLYSQANETHLRLLSDMLTESEWIAESLEQIVDALENTSGDDLGSDFEDESDPTG